MREALTVELLHDRYMDINAIIDRVQKSIDEAQGLHLAPQHSPFYDDRAHQIGSALADPTVPDETIKRRARAATATATKAMHDDRMKSEAKFRSRAGLKCFITRKAVSGCCAWCTAMAGRFEYGEEPDDIYRRHDNCDCTVTFENGRKRQDVWSKREWETPEPGAGAGERVVLTEEQASELEAKHLPEVLTNGEKRDIMNIRLDDIKTAVTGSPISEEVAEYIFSVLAEHRDQFKFDGVKVLALDPKIVMQTDPVQNGTFYDIVLNLNSAFLGGKTVQQLDAEIEASNVTRANSLREAVIHEIYHGKMYYQKNKGEIDALYEVLEGIKIDGISRTAYKDGFECIAEVGVLYERGETSDIPKDAKDLFFKYLGVKI
ncbi:MAG: hypothetical protein IJM46_04030 [Oscillospiraceae bacterium]|nr:hypothetical protein [Oscillospiraceae bacterium]